MIHNLIIFASGTGTNAKAVIEYFKNDPRVQVSLIVCNNPAAGVIRNAEKENIPVLLIDRDSFGQDSFPRLLSEYNPSLILLAGFLWKIPESTVRTYEGKIINIHPALLPAYGGKGMYGMRVHESVLAAGEKKSGITIHYVNEKYDEGAIILQAQCPVLPDDTADVLAARIHRLEHFYLPRTIRFLLDTYREPAI